MKELCKIGNKNTIL